MQTIINGSPKQIEWAERISTDYLASFDRLSAVGDTDSNDDRTGRSIIKGLMLSQKTTPGELSSVARWLLEQTDARWWIDHRDLGIEGFVTMHRDRS